MIAVDGNVGFAIIIKWNSNFNHLGQYAGNQSTGVLILQCNVEELNCLIPSRRIYSIMFDIFGVFLFFLNSEDNVLILFLCQFIKTFCRDAAQHALFG